MTLACKFCHNEKNVPGKPFKLNGDVGCTVCGCIHCGHSLIWKDKDGGGNIVSMWHYTCRNCGRDSLHGTCRKSVGKRVKYTGTNDGLPVSGEGRCLEQHDSHGLCIVVLHDDGTRVVVDPITVEIL